jgi:beta-N-acetylhexosaminidase
MEGRLPPDDDDLFEWTDAPARPPRQPEPGTGEREPVETGERDRVGTGERDRVGTGERDRVGTGERQLSPVERATQLLRRRRSQPTRERASQTTAERRAVRGDTGEFERSGRRPPPGRRERHRDLPAQVRRRQAIGIGVIALVLVIGLIVLVSGGGGEEQKETPVKKLVGQSIVAKLGAKGPDAALIKAVRKGQVGGVIVFPRNAQTLAADVDRLQAAAEEGDNSPLLVMIDQEGGDVKRLKDGPPEQSPQQLGQSGDADAAKTEGKNTGTYLNGLGVNTDLAPVLDVAHPPLTDKDIASRTFGEDPAVVSTVGVAFAEGLQDGGVIATAKHFPGLGRATQSTDEQPVSIAATTEDLQGDVIPFKDAIEAGVGMVMVSTATYPTLGAKVPAAFSPAIVTRLLRNGLGFKGVVITDDLETPAVTGEAAPGAAAAAALRAGDDLLLYARGGDDSTKAFGSLVSQVKKGQLERSVVQQAYDRIASLKETLGSQ